MLIDSRTGMKITTRASLGRTLVGRSDGIPLPLNDVIIVGEDGEPIGVWMPWGIWFQIQHFVHRVLER